MAITASQLLGQVLPRVIRAHVAPLTLTALLLLSGCTSTPHVPTSVDEASSGNTPTPQSEPAQARSTALVQIIASGQQAINTGECQRAIDVAERGQRIDRYQPELYLILAQGYQCLGQQAQSTGFAQLGLRYAGADLDLRAKLESLLAPE